MLNRVTFIGFCGKDCELRYLPSGVAVANFSVASTEKWKDKDGSQQERTEWLRCNAFERLAEICGEYIKKGTLVYVEGNLQTRKWTDKDGIEKYATECRVKEMKLLGGKPDQAPAPLTAPAPRPTAKAPATPFDDMDNDMPF